MPMTIGAGDLGAGTPNYRMHVSVRFAFRR